MIKIVSNIKKRLAVFLLSALLIGQGSGYLAQKIMVENNIRERIKDDLTKQLEQKNLHCIYQHFYKVCVRFRTLLFKKNAL